MRLIKTVRLAVLASLALSMAASVSASATLGGFECVAGTGTSGLGSNCLAEAGGTFTVKPLTGAKSTGKLVGSTVFTAGTKKIECTSGSGEGIVTSLTEGYGTAKATGCKEEPSGVNCESSGAGPGTLVFPVSVKIVSYLNSNGELKVGLLGALRNATGANEATFECAGTRVTLYGSVVGSVDPEDTMSLSFTAKLVVTGGVQEIQETTNSLRAKFASGATEKATEAGTGVTSFALQVEIMG